jgi:hypothetical protein
MKLFKLCFLGFYLNGALGSGKYDDLTIEEVKERIEDRTIFDYLQEKLQGDIDLSILTPEDKQELNNEWSQLVNVVDESRKLCVRNDKGLCLLVAYLFEGIQWRTGIDMDIPSKAAPS